MCAVADIVRLLLLLMKNYRSFSCCFIFVGYFSSRKEVDPNDGEFPFDFSAVGLHYRAPFNMR